MQWSYTACVIYCTWWGKLTLGIAVAWWQQFDIMDVLLFFTMWRNRKINITPSVTHTTSTTFLIYVNSNQSWTCFSSCETDCGVYEGFIYNSGRNLVHDAQTPLDHLQYVLGSLNPTLPARLFIVWHVESQNKPPLLLCPLSISLFIKHNYLILNYSKLSPTPQKTLYHRKACRMDIKKVSKVKRFEWNPVF